MAVPKTWPNRKQKLLGRHASIFLNLLARFGLMNERM